MKIGFSRWLVAGVVALLFAMPGLAVVETTDHLAPGLRPELVTPDPPRLSASRPPVNQTPDPETPPRDPGDDFDGPRIDLPDRHPNLLDQMLIERDGRSNPDGSPRLKDLVPPQRRR